MRDMANVVNREQAVIDQYSPKTQVDRSGYRLRGVLQDGRLNWRG